jgi:hypothetical protein
MQQANHDAMIPSLPPPMHMPCSECGASVVRGEESAHVCDGERRLDFRVFQLREAIAAFDVDLAAWLESPRGRFELFYAEWERARRARSIKPEGA